MTVKRRGGGGGGRGGGGAPARRVGTAVSIYIYD